MPPISKPVKKKKRKVGRPTFSRKDIPEEFFRYYDAYRYGFMNKREFSKFLGVSRPTLDRYFDVIGAKEPIVSKAENNRLRKELKVGSTPMELLNFSDFLRARHNDKNNSTGSYGI
ncbi:MAG: hypothetical protein IJE17_05730 [Clostridia bacterium]|nr:hypothetical protein [Clostridia bacterium]